MRDADRTLRSRILAVLLCLLMLPSVGELLEIAVHVVDHGDLAHLIDREDHDHPEGDEHGCSELFHICGCHTSYSLPSPTTARALATQPPAARAAFADELDLADQFRPAPALRPPIV